MILGHNTEKVVVEPVTFQGQYSHEFDYAKLEHPLSYSKELKKYCVLGIGGNNCMTN